MVSSSAQALLTGQLQKGPRLPDSQGLGVGTFCWFGAREWEQYTPQDLLMTKKHKNLLPEKGRWVSAWLPGAYAMGCRAGLESHLPHLPSNPVRVAPFLRAPVKIQGLSQMLTHSSHFSSL